MDNIQYTQEDGVWLAKDLVTGVSTEGETREESEYMIRDALKLFHEEP